MPNSPAPNSGSAFRDLDGGSGLLFSVASRDRLLHFGAGRCSWYPQNNATASTLASDKHFTSRILREAGVPALGGEYFFLHERYRAHRPAGHERSDAVAYFKTLGGSAFVKPLTGSRGDFAQAVHGEAALVRYLDEVTKYYDAVADPADRRGNRVSRFPARRRRALLRAKISAVRHRRWRAQRSVNCSPPITTPCALAACRRLRCRKIHRSMPYRRRASGGTFPGG